MPTTPQRWLAPRVRGRLVIAFALAVAGAASTPISADGQSGQVTAGRNVSMLGGEQTLSLEPWRVRGDVLGKAQNEPSCAKSTRDPLHILCGANDYRMVDVPGVTETTIIRDAWLGVLQSANGGDTWESTLLGGFFLDPTPHPLKSGAFTAAADPVVRSGPAGMAYYAGIAFVGKDPVTGVERSRSALHVTAFADLNNRQNDPMPFKPVRTTIVQQVASPQFIDKPWIFVEAAPAGQWCPMIVPTDGDWGTQSWVSSPWGGKVMKWLSRWTGWQPQSFVPQLVPASVIHVVYTVFLDTSDTTAQIMYAKSDDCGATFSRPARISGAAEKASGDDLHGNGATIAKPMVNGSRTIYTAWRAVEQIDPVTKAVIAPNAIMTAMSTNNGASWSRPTVLAQSCPFDQRTTRNTFRTTAFPTMTADAGGRVYVAWADRARPDGRCPAPNDSPAPSRIRVATSTNGVQWSISTPVASAGLEHQVQPSLAFTAGRLFLAWIDFTCDASQVFERHVNEAQVSLAKKPPAPGTCESPPVSSPSASVRHTGDVRVATAAPAAAPAFANNTTTVSEYLKGISLSSGLTQKVQLQWNAVNRRWARKGTVPFNGDYIDIAVNPYLPPDPARGRMTWEPNNKATTTVMGPSGPVSLPTVPDVLIAWADNRDMRNAPKADSPSDPSVQYTVPLNTPNLNGKSFFDPTQIQPVCNPGVGAYTTGTMNQNVYASRATSGWLAASPGNNKSLGAVQRAFVLFIRNEDVVNSKIFRLTAYQPAGGIASFDQFNRARTTLDVVVRRRSSVSKTVFVSQDLSGSATLDPNATVRVDVVETAGVGGTATQGVAVYLNADPSAPEIDSPEIDSREVYTPEIDSPEIDSPEIDSPEIDSPEIDSPEIDSETLLALGLGTPEIDSPEIDSPEIDSPEIDSPEIDSTAVRDVTFTVTNTGNTTAEYQTKAFLAKSGAAGLHYQVIVRQRYSMPAVRSDCTATTLTLSKVLVNEPEADLSTPEIDSPEIDSPEIDSSSFYIPPGESADIIVRVRDDVSVSTSTQALTALTSESFELAVQQRAVDTEQAEEGITEPPVITTFLSVATTGLPSGTVATPYNYQLGSSGGVAPVSWSVVAGANQLAASGLTLSSSGLLSGTPSAANTYTFTAQVADSSSPPQTATEEFVLVITSPGTNTLAFVTQPVDTPPGALIRPAPSVKAVNGSGTAAVGLAVTLQVLGPTGSVTGTLTQFTGATGIAVFDNLTVNSLATGLALTATAPNFGAATSVTFGGVLPDLVVQSLTHFPATPTTADTITFTAVVKNNGTGAAGPSTLLFTVGGETPGTPQTLYQVPSLAPGGTFSVERQLTLPAQNYSNTATADHGEQVVETNETNNTATDSYSVTQSQNMVYPGDAQWTASVQDGAAAEISSSNPRSGLGSLELVSGIDRTARFTYTPPAPLGTYAQLSTLSYDWYIDPESVTALPGLMTLRVYDASDPRTFLIGWDPCRPTCRPQPTGAWQTTNSLLSLSVIRGEFGAAPSSPADIPPDAPITGIVIAGHFAFGGPWFGYLDNVRVGFGGSLPTVFNFEVANPAQRRNRPAVTWTNPSPVPGGTALSAVELTATANVTGAFTYVPAAGTTLAPEFHILTTSFAPSDAQQYLSTAKIVPLMVTGTRIVPPGDQWLPYLSQPTAFAAITNANKRSGSGSLELRKELGEGAAFIREQRRLPLGRLNELTALSYDWFIDPASSAPRPPEIALRVYEYGDPRSFFLFWNACPLDQACPTYDIGSWQTTDVRGMLSIQSADGNPAPTSLAQVPTDAPITGIHLRTAYANGQPWHGFVDHVHIAFGGHAPIVYNFEAGVAIESVSLQSQTAVIDGPSVPYNAMLQNNGAALGSVFVQTYVDQGSAMRAAGGAVVGCDGTPGNLPPGACVFTFQLVASNATAGTGTLVRGPAVARFELRQSNPPTLLDTYVVPITLAERSDLVVGSLTHSPANPTTADTITLTATVQNLGPGTADASTALVSVTGESQGTPQTLFPVPVLAPGATHVVQRQLTGTAAQGYVTTAVADYLAMVSEVNEDNNTRTDSFMVSAPAGGTLVVTNTNDGGAGSLRQGILNANAAPGAQTIAFDISGPGPYVITPSTALPTLTGPVSIDGSTQPGWSGRPVIELDGVNAGLSNGLTITASDSTVRGLVIRRFPGNGIHISDAATNNVIAGNYIGLDRAGTGALGNAKNGVHIVDSSANRIGGPTSADMNVISANGAEGVRIDGAAATDNTIQGNYIGTNGVGAAALGNGGSGVYIRRSSRHNVLGNVVSGNIGFAGVAICGSASFCGGGDVGTQGNNSSNNTIQGNAVGTDATGAAALGNAQRGISIDGAPDTIIGGTNPAQRNVISGNQATGLVIFGASATGTRILGNYIGLNGSGGSAIPNGTANNPDLRGGIRIEGVENTTIGGGTPTPGTAAGNVISGNVGNGIHVLSTATGTPTTTVIGNIIGLDIAGATAVANQGAGVRTDDGGVLVGGTTTGDRNIVSGNNTGIVLANNGRSHYSSIQGNYIGTDITGMAPRGQSNGVWLQSAPGTAIGGTAAGAGNVISASSIGVVINGIANPVIAGLYAGVVQGNLIGLRADGSGPLGNGTGISINFISGTAGFLIGGPTAATRNVISANTGNGVTIVGGPNNLLQGNYIGTDAAGSAGRANGGIGVHIIDASGNVIGGDVSGRNVISANGGEGVRIDGAGSTGNNVSRNYIGSTASGSGDLGNGGSGVYIRRAPSNTVSFNTVVFNRGHAGIAICGNATLCAGADQGSQSSNAAATTVSTNFVVDNFGHGVSIDGAPATSVTGNEIAANQRDGVTVFNAGAGSTTIETNGIHDNLRNGVSISGATNTRNAVRMNNIRSNGLLGIDLGDNGVTPNDNGDADAGPNNLQNYPVITAATTTSLSGMLDSAPGAYSILLYRNPSCDPSGFGEGTYVIGSVPVTVDESGLGAFTVNGTFTAGEFITAVATDAGGSTSEFAACSVVQPPSDLQIAQLMHSPANPTPSDTITFTASVKNAGPSAAPASKLLFAIGGETPGATGTVFEVPALAPGATFTVTRTRVLNVSQAYTNTATADYTAVVAEADETNNSATDTFNVTYTATTFAPGHILVTHTMPDGSAAVSELGVAGNFLRRFPAAPNDGRAHLAVAAGSLFHSNGLSNATISQFDGSGTLLRTISPNSSAQHRIGQTARDFQDQSIYFVDIDAGSNVVRHLDTPATGASSFFSTVSYPGIGGFADMYAIGAGAQGAVYVLTQTSPSGGRVYRINADGTNTQISADPRLNLPFSFDVGSITVGADGLIYVATSTDVVVLDATGSFVNSFAAVDSKPSLDVGSNGQLYMGHFGSTDGRISVFSGGALLQTITVPVARRIIDVVVVP